MPCHCWIASHGLETARLLRPFTRWWTSDCLHRLRGVRSLLSPPSPPSRTPAAPLQPCPRLFRLSASSALPPSRSVPPVAAGPSALILLSRLTEFTHLSVLESPFVLFILSASWAKVSILSYSWSGVSPSAQADICDSHIPAPVGLILSVISGLFPSMPFVLCSWSFLIVWEKLDPLRPRRMSASSRGALRSLLAGACSHLCTWRCLWGEFWTLLKYF